MAKLLVIFWTPLPQSFHDAGERGPAKVAHRDAVALGLPSGVVGDCHNERRNGIVGIILCCDPIVSRKRLECPVIPPIVGPEIYVTPLEHLSVLQKGGNELGIRARISGIPPAGLKGDDLVAGSHLGAIRLQTRGRSKFQTVLASEICKV